MSEEKAARERVLNELYALIGRARQHFMAAHLLPLEKAYRRLSRDNDSYPDPDITPSSGNVFADLGLPEMERLLAEADACIAAEREGEQG